MPAQWGREQGFTWHGPTAPPGAYSPAAVSLVKVAGSHSPSTDMLMFFLLLCCCGHHLREKRAKEPRQELVPGVRAAGE